MNSDVGRVVQHLRQLLEGEGTAGLRDDQLLLRFAHHHEEDAFAALVHRHGPLVLGVCRRLLPNPHDADDAFQAAFLVLARRAGSIRKAGSVASWLYGVALRIARRSKADIIRRRRLEQSVPSLPEVRPPDPALAELRAVLDEELARLPERCRQAVLLCDLEGRTQEDAAAHLNLPRGTLKRRLEKGRELLRRRLTRRGLALAGLATALTSDSLQAAVSAVLGTATTRAGVAFAAGQAIPIELASVGAVALAKGVLRTMLTAKLRFLGLLSALAIITLSGAVLVAQQGAAPSAVAVSPVIQPPAPQPMPQKEPTDAERLQGLWMLLAVTDNGVEVPPKEIVGTYLKVKGEQIAWLVSGELPEWGTFRLDPAQQPGHITIRAKQDGRDITSIGIYKFDGPKLYICVSEEKAGRPKEFAAGENSSAMLLMLERGDPKREEQPQVIEVKGPADGVTARVVLPGSPPKLSSVNDGRFKIVWQFENTGKQDVVLWPYLDVTLKDDNGQEVQRSRKLGRFGLRNGNQTLLEQMPFVTLKPGEAHRIEVNLGNCMCAADMIQAWKLSGAGTYVVELHYHYDRAEAKKRYGEGKTPNIDNADQLWNRALEVDRKAEVKMRVVAD